jgi:hypothetical protein
MAAEEIPSLVSSTALPMIQQLLGWYKVALPEPVGGRAAAHCLGL